jgi:hypothetical protein
MGRWQARAVMAVRMVCAAALLCLGFAHQAPAIAGGVDYSANAYRLPDGSFPVLCISGDGAAHGKVVLKPGCEVCRLASSTILPQPNDGAGILISGLFLLNPLPEASVALGAGKVGRANSRAPPVFF